MLVAADRLKHETKAAIANMEACIQHQPHQRSIQLGYVDLLLGDLIHGVPVQQQPAVL